MKNIPHYNRPDPNASKIRRIKNRNNIILAICMLIILAFFIALMASKFSSENTMSNKVSDNNKTYEQEIGYFYGKTVCLDPGHGFDDAGTSSEYLGEKLEKDITLELAFYLKSALEKKGATVIMTHDGKTFPQTKEDDGNNVFSPKERVAFANACDIDMYISLHVDSYEADTRINGMRVYYCNKGDENTLISDKLCEKIALAVDSSGLYNNETLIKPSPSNDAYYVTKHVNVPSVLIETGFCTNKQDAKNLLNDEWLKKLAKTIASLT